MTHPAYGKNAWMFIISIRKCKLNILPVQKPGSPIRWLNHINFIILI